MIQRVEAGERNGLNRAPPPPGPASFCSSWASSSVSGPRRVHPEAVAEALRAGFGFGSKTFLDRRNVRTYLGQLRPSSPQDCPVCASFDDQGARVLKSLGSLEALENSKTWSLVEGLSDFWRGFWACKESSSSRDRCLGSKSSVANPRTPRSIRSQLRRGLRNSEDVSGFGARTSRPSGRPRHLNDEPAMQTQRPRAVPQTQEHLHGVVSS